LLVFLKPILQVGEAIDDSPTGFNKRNTEVADSSVFLKSRGLQPNYFSGLAWGDGKRLGLLWLGCVRHGLTPSNLNETDRTLVHTGRVLQRI
jgi:hypothetical protein